MDDAGVLQSTTSYDAWGTPQGAAPPPPFGFTGEWQDANKGLVYLRARWYQPGSGRFLSRDPFPGLPERPATLAPYPYAENDPINKLDPSGNLAVFVAGGLSYPGDPAASDPTAEGAHDVGVWYMARRYSNRIRGKTFLATALAQDRIQHEVMATHQITCGREPIILVGHSRGAASVMITAAMVAKRDPSIRIDLVVTIGMIPYPTDFSWHLIDDTVKAKNVERQINMRSDQSWKVLKEDIFGSLEGTVRGSEEYMINGATHTTVDNEFLDRDRKKQTVLNPAWNIIKEAIDKVR